MKNFLPKPLSFVHSLNLQTRLILGNLIVTFIAVAGLGFYIYYRAQQDNAFLADQLNKSVLQHANDSIGATSSEEANKLDEVFSSAQTNITILGTTTYNLLDQETTLNEENYWDASKSLNRLPNGSWDNSRADVASVFVPAKKDLTSTLVSELNAIKQLDFTAPAMLNKTNPYVVAVYFGGLKGETLYYPNIDLANVVPPDFDVTQRPWFVDASPAQDPTHQAVWTDPYLDAASNGLVVTISTPVYDVSGSFRGVVAMDLRLNRITQIVSNIKIGQTGYAFLVDKNDRLIGMPNSGYKELGISSSAVPLGQVLAPNKVSAQLPAKFWTVLNKMSQGQSGLETIQINGVDHLIAYNPLPSVGYSLAIIVPSKELTASALAAQEQVMQSARSTLLFSWLLALVVLVISLIASLLISGALTSPLRALTQTAREITAGNLEAKANIDSQNEIGTLATVLNTMTSTLRENIQSLEQRVQERTADLKSANEINARRAQEFEAIAITVKAINTIHQMDQLLPQITSVISEHFGYYHVGIFLNDENNLNAILRASNSEGGKRMLERGHQLKIGEQGIVGNVAATGNIRVARNVGDDTVYFDNPDLPETLSEMALPLKVEKQIVGVLDVQSKQVDAFSQEDIGVLSLLADEVSIAIENTRLLETASKTLAETETIYRQYLQQAWRRLPREQKLAGYRYSSHSAALLEKPIDLDTDAGTADKETQRVAVPIKLRGQTIGNLVVQVPNNAHLNGDQLDLMQAVAERLALSTENARLFDETSRRAERERMVTEITSKIRSTNSPDEMIEIALGELRNALGATQVQLIPQTASAPNGNKLKGTSELRPRTVPEPGGNGAKQ